MTAGNWISIAVIALALELQIIAFAYFMGQIAAELKSVRAWKDGATSGPGELLTLARHSEVCRLNDKVFTQRFKNIEELLEEIKEQVKGKT